MLRMMIVCVRARLSARSSWDTVKPTEYALLKNGITGAVDLETVYRNGRHWVGPSQHFVKFPAVHKTLSYGDRSFDNNNYIPARTGADLSAQISSGGQPLNIALTFQYVLDPSRIAQLYLKFGSDWERSYLRFAQQAVTNVVQLYQPTSFWTYRAEIESAVHASVNHTIYEFGFAIVPTLQLRWIGFQSSYEQTITNIQLQHQLKITKSYQLEVTRVLKEVDLMQSETDAGIKVINADAHRQRDIILGEANAAALLKEQGAKASMFAQLISHLSWSSGDFLQYAKMRALNSQPQSNVVVGVNAVGSIPPS